MVTFSKPIHGNEPQGNIPQELKPIILLERPKPQELANGKYHMYKLCMVPYNNNSPTSNLVVPFLIPELLKIS
eukprot:15250948-Ditylum_brightwellii.AAC.1